MKIDRTSVKPPIALVTGVFGQDGSYLAESLIQQGWEVHGITRPGSRCSHDEVHIHEADLTDSDRTSAIVRNTEPDVIFNLGGISSVGYSWKEPYHTALVTGAAPIALMEAAIDLQEATGKGVRFLQASSAEIFGSAPAPQSETTPIAPISPYGVAKSMAHSAVSMFRAQGLAASAAILFNHESVRRPRSFVTRKITLGVAAIKLGLRDKLELGNLEARRDFGWAPDYVEAMIKIAAASVPDDFVVATGVSHSIREFAEVAFAVAGLEEIDRYVRVDPNLSRTADASTMRGDPAKIARVLGWTATTPFEEIVRRMVEHDLNWFEQRRDSADATLL